MKNSREKVRSAKFDADRRSRVDSSRFTTFRWPSALNRARPDQSRSKGLFYESRMTEFSFCCTCRTEQSIRHRIIWKVPKHRVQRRYRETLRSREKSGAMAWMWRLWMLPNITLSYRTTFLHIIQFLLFTYINYLLTYLLLQDNYLIFYIIFYHNHCYLKKLTQGYAQNK